MNTTRIGRTVATVAVLLGLVACDGVLDVSDPQRYTSDDLDQALDAVAAGVEGDLYIAMDQFVIYQGLLGDELQHTGTWAGYDDIDHGRFNYANHNAETTYQELLRARWFAGDARERFIRVLGESEAATSPLMAQVQTVEATADMLLGMAYCEAPAVQSGPAVSFTEILRQAEEEFTTALQTAQAAGADDWILVNYAGRARVRLYLGDYQGAASDAAQIPDGWEKMAQFSANSGRQENDVVQLTTAQFNRAASVREKWWDAYDHDTRSLLDPYTGEPDPRKAVFFDGSLGVDGVTDHYSQWKYRALGDDIPLLEWEEMRLIEAEAAWQAGDLDGTQAILNALRAEAGLSDLPATGDADMVKAYLLNERLAETWMEGHRVVDLRRLGELRATFAALNDPERPPTRPTMFSMDDEEARDNPEIEDDASVRCLPMT